MPSYRRILPSPFRRILPSPFRRIPPSSFRRIPPSSFRRIPRRPSVQCNNESPGATRYLTGYRDKPGMTMKVNAAIPNESPFRRHSGEFPRPRIRVIPANSPSSFRRIPRRHSGHAGIQCNNESPGATRYLTGYRDKPGMTMKVNAAIPANSPAIPANSPVVIPANSPSSFRRIPRRHSGAPSSFRPCRIQCNNESPGATRYLTGYRDKPGMTMKVNAAIPANSSAVILGHVVSQWTTVFQTRNTYSLPGSLSQSGGKLLRLSM